MLRPIVGAACKLFGIPADAPSSPPWCTEELALFFQILIRSEKEFNEIKVSRTEKKILSNLDDERKCQKIKEKIYKYHYRGPRTMFFPQKCMWTTKIMRWLSIANQLFIHEDIWDNRSSSKKDSTQSKNLKICILSNGSQSKISFMDSFFGKNIRKENYAMVTNLFRRI